MINNIYTNTHILNRKEYQKCKNELILIDYLPVLLRRLCGTSYYEQLFSKPNQEKIKDKIHKTSNYNRKQIILEFIEWCKDNNYTNLINSKEEEKLKKELKEIKKELGYLGG